MKTFIEHYTDFTSNQETTERIHQWVAISIVAAALERRCWLNRGPYVLFPNLYTFIIGPSGKVKKSTSTAIGVNMLRELPDISIMSERLTAASLICQLEASKKSFQYQGRDILQSPCFSYGSELAVFLGEVFGSISELLTTFYDCIPHDSSKPWVYATKSSGTSEVYGPCLNFLGASTPTWLVRCLPRSELEGGFASRVIFVVENNQRQAIAWPDEIISSDDHAARRRYLITDLKRIYDMRGPFIVTQAMRKFGKDWYEEYSSKSLSNIDIRFSGYYARKFDTLLKLSMVLSAAEDASLQLDVRHFEKAIKLLDDVEYNMFEAFGARGENPNVEIADKIWRLLADSPTKSLFMGDLYGKIHRDASFERMQAAITDLRIMGRVRQFTHPQAKDFVVQAIDSERPLGQ